MQQTQDLDAATPSLFRPDPVTFAAMFLDGTEATTMLGISRTHIYKMIDRGVITPYRIGALTVFWRPAIEQLHRARAQWYGRPR